MKEDMSNFDSNPLTCNPLPPLSPLFPAKYSPNSAKSNRFFLERERRLSLDFDIFG